MTCVLTKGLKGRKEEMTPLQWQSTFWSIFLSSSRLHGLIPSFFTHFMRLFSFLTVCSCFLKPPFYSVVTIFCNFFFLRNNSNTCANWKNKDNTRYPIRSIYHSYFHDGGWPETSAWIPHLSPDRSLSVRKFYSGGQRPVARTRPRVV